MEEEKKNPEPIPKEDIVKRFRSALGLPIEEETQEQNELLVIEDMKRGLRISLGSLTENIHTLFKLSKEIKKEFFS